MRRTGLTLKMVTWAITLCFLSSCTVRVPARFLGPDEAYAPGAVTAPSPDVPFDSVKKSVFEAPYEDVFRAVSVAASQAQFNVESTDKKSGVIRATRTVAVKNRVGGGSATRIYYYEIVVKEMGAESTEVTVFSKYQESCTRSSGFTWTMVSLLTFGIALPTALIAYPVERRQCNRAAELQWATEDYNSLQEMGQLMTFIRNNLIAAGVL